jgi:hypothetical protein
MIFGVLERLFIVEHTDRRLILREYPLLGWLFGGAFIIGSGNLFLIGLDATALGSVVLGILCFMLSRVRVLTFDREHQRLQVVGWYLIVKRSLLELSFADIQGVSLFEQNQHTQIVLHTTKGDTGLSVYSHDLTDWKSPLVEAIEKVLGKES